MKTTKVFIGLFSVLAVANLFLSEWLIFGYVVLCLIFNVLLLHEERKNAQLTSKLTDAEVKVFMQRDEIKKLTADREDKKDFEESQRVKQCELLVEISDLKTQLETAKANSYTEIERKRGREKYARLYKGKKKAVLTQNQNSEQPYTIEGKTIKQLVEENLWVEIKADEYVKGILCGFNDSSAIIGNYENELGAIGHNAVSDSTVILKECRPNSYYWVIDDNFLCNAIKKHRNIQ